MKELEQKSDEELAGMVQQNKLDAFEILVQRYEKKLSRYAKKFIFNHQNIEDAVQEVFIKAYENMQSFNTSKKFSSWIYRIAHNHFINIIKKKKPFLFFDPDVIFTFSSKSDVEEDVMEIEEKEEIEKCLDRLDFKYKEVVVLYYFEDKSYEEISDILTIPVSTVGVRLRRARKKVKDIYGKRK